MFLSKSIQNFQDMKNTIKIYFILAIVLVSANSCKDALTEEPLTFYSEETVFSTEDGVETAVNGIYAQLSSGQYYGTSWHNLTMPLSGKFYSSQAANRDATGLNTTPSNRWVRDLWAQMYATINTANTVISNLEKSTLSLANQDRALGEAYFLRGLVYLDMLRLFGGVPIRTEPTTLDDLHQSRATRNEVIDLVISDLEKAKMMLPNTDATELGRPAAFAANVYLAKLYMTLAGEDGGDASFWSKAQTELLEVFNSQAYTLTPTYAELFIPENENTSESIFELQYGHTGGTRNTDIVRSFTPANSTYAPSNVTTFGRIRPNKETFDQHVAQYPDDPRIDATFVYDAYEKSDGGTQKIYPDKKTGNQGFAVIAKWFDPSYNGITTTRNIIMLRYADVLLMMAEIENELNGPEGAYQYINPVLARARYIDGDGMSDSVEPAEWVGLTQDDFRKRIFKERFYELLAEGQEWFDSHRRGYDVFIQEIVEPHNNNPTIDLPPSGKDFIYPIDEKNMLLPIPLSEISGNQLLSIEDQNPGY